MTRTLLTARWIVAHHAGTHRILENAQLLIENGTVAWTGPAFPGETDTRLDFGNAVISPGFVDLDALSDLDTTILGHDAGPAWKTGRVWPESYVARGPYEMYSPEELAFQKRFAFAQLIRNGITTALPIASLFYRAWGETVPEFDAAADAAEALGLRVYLGPAYRTGNQVTDATGTIRPVYDEPRGLAELDAAIAYAHRIEGRAAGRIRAMFAPDRIETCTGTLLRRTADAARELSAPVRQHCCQSPTELRLVREQHGCSPIEWLDGLGVLGPDWLLPHGTHATDTDLGTIRDAGAALVHCPLVAGRHGGALRSFRELQESGLKIGMGTDTWPPDMLLNLSVGQILARTVEGSTACQSRHYFDAATFGGADALNRPDLGRLAVGARADIAVISLDRTLATTDPIQTLLTGCTGRDVTDVFVDGRRIMEGGVIPGVDDAADFARAQTQFDGLIAKYPERTLGHPPVAEIFTSSYPRGLP